MKELSRYDFNEEIRLSESSAVIFMAPWCSFCESLLKICEAVEKLSPETDFFKVNIEENSELASKYEVKSVPTTIVFKGSNELARKTGLMSKRELLEMAKT